MMFVVVLMLRLYAVFCSLMKVIETSWLLKLLSQVKLGKLYRINRVVVEGLQSGNGSYVTSYKLKYSYHGAVFDYLVVSKQRQISDSNFSKKPELDSGIICNFSYFCFRALSEFLKVFTFENDGNDQKRQ